jgi:Uncharacterized protein conserved in bacteria (DUF2314)
VLDAIVSWQMFIVALIAFGFAPGAVLRLICLAFWPDDPRREELRAELHAVPRLERPFWVLEQLEVALFEGVFERLRWAATGRIIHRWRLGSGVERNRAYPESFPIPSEEMKRLIVPGMVVKDGSGERMWVDVTAVDGERLVGVLCNTPCVIPRLEPGDEVMFEREHIIDIDVPDERLPPELRVRA